MHSVQLVPPEINMKPTDLYGSAVSILAALEAAIHERTLAQVACGDLSARKLAILELTRLVSMPPSDDRTQRVNALIAEFGAEDVARWLERITS